MDVNYVITEGIENVVKPRKGDLGYDIKAQRIIEETDCQITYGTGVKVEPLKGRVHGLIFPRSSVRNYNLRLANSVAVIDSSYRGEIMLTFDKIGTNATTQKFYEVGDKIAQIIWFKQVEVHLMEGGVEENTERNDDGFGSTGR